MWQSVIIGLGPNLPQNVLQQGSGFDRQLVPATVDPEFDKSLLHECVQL
jgi:hypothetical protein